MRERVIHLRFWARRYAKPLARVLCWIFGHEPAGAIYGDPLACSWCATQKQHDERAAELWAKHEKLGSQFLPWNKNAQPPSGP